MPRRPSEARLNATVSLRALSLNDALNAQIDDLIATKFHSMAVDFIDRVCEDMVGTEMLGVDRVYVAQRVMKSLDAVTSEVIRDSLEDGASLALACEAFGFQGSSSGLRSRFPGLGDPK